MAKRQPDARQNSFGYPAAQQQAIGGFFGPTIPPIPIRGDKEQWRHEKLIAELRVAAQQNQGLGGLAGGAAAQAAQGSNQGLGSYLGPKLGPFG